MRTAAEQDARIDAVLGGGSYLHGGMDEHSDVDLVIVSEGPDYQGLMAERRAFAATLGDLLAAFTGEHVGEPRLLICLYGPPLLHVDLKFVDRSAPSQMVERPAVVFARDPDAISRWLDMAEIAWPEMSADWFEERVWVWLHYAATKLGRGELFEAIGMLAFLREQVLGPMIYRRAGRPQRGARRIEQIGLDPDGRLAATVARHDPASIGDALEAAMELYLELRADRPPYRPTPEMPAALRTFLTAARHQALSSSSPWLSRD